MTRRDLTEQTAAIKRDLAEVIRRHRVDPSAIGDGLLTALARRVVLERWPVDAEPTAQA